MSADTREAHPHSRARRDPAEGYLFMGQAVPETMKAAAKATLAAGYTHFRLSDASSEVGTRTSVACIGGRYGDGCLPLPESQAGVTVTMFRAKQPGAAGAFDAAQVLAKYSQYGEARTRPCEKISISENSYDFFLTRPAAGMWAQRVI